MTIGSGNAAAAPLEAGRLGLEILEQLTDPLRDVVAIILTSSTNVFSDGSSSIQSR